MGKPAAYYTELFARLGGLLEGFGTVPETRAVAEAAGYDVSWDKEFGVTVKDGSDILFQICPDTKLAHGPAAADRHSLAGPCLIANGVTYLEAGDLAHLLGMFYGG